MFVAVCLCSVPTNNDSWVAINKADVKFLPLCPSPTCIPFPSDSTFAIRTHKHKIFFFIICKRNCVQYIKFHFVVRSRQHQQEQPPLQKIMLHSSTQRQDSGCCRTPLLTGHQEEHKCVVCQGKRKTGSMH